MMILTVTPELPFWQYLAGCHYFRTSLKIAETDICQVVPSLSGGGDKGNEAAGLTAAWLLVDANLSVVRIERVKRTNKVVPMGNG